MFRDYASFYGGTSPNPQAWGPHLLGCPLLLIQYIRSYPPYWRPFFHPQPEDAPCRCDKGPLTMEWYEHGNELYNRSVCLNAFTQPNFRCCSPVLLVSPLEKCDRPFAWDVFILGTGQTYSTYTFILTLRWLMSYIYGAPILDVSRSHTTTQHSR